MQHCIFLPNVTVKFLVVHYFVYIFLVLFLLFSFSNFSFFPVSLSHFQFSLRPFAKKHHVLHSFFSQSFTHWFLPNLCTNWVPCYSKVETDSFRKFGVEACVRVKKKRQTIYRWPVPNSWRNDVNNLFDTWLNLCDKPVVCRASNDVKRWARNFFFLHTFGMRKYARSFARSLWLLTLSLSISASLRLVRFYSLSQSLSYHSVFFSLVRLLLDRHRIWLVKREKKSVTRVIN